MQVKLHFVQIILIAVLIFAVFFAGHQTAITNNTPAPIVNNYIDVNVILPPISFDKNMFASQDKNYSPNIIVNVTQKPSSDSSVIGGATTYVTNNYVTDSNTPVVYYQFSLKAFDGNGDVIVNDTNSFADGTPALTAMQQMTSVGFTQDPTYGAYINSINGVKAVGSQWWDLYQDGNESSVGISYIVINKPTSVALKLCDTWPCPPIAS